MKGEGRRGEKRGEEREGRRMHERAYVRVYMCVLASVCIDMCCGVCVVPILCLRVHFVRKFTFDFVLRKLHQTRRPLRS